MSQVLLTGGGVLGGVVVVVAFAKFLLGSALSTLQQEIKTLRERMEDQDRKLIAIEALYDEQRKEKHRLANEYTKAQVLLGVIIDLAEKCTCGALDIVKDLLARIAVTPADLYSGLADPHEGGTQ